MKSAAKNIGMSLEIPKQNCNDIKCPFHGNLSVRGRQFTGTLTSTNMRKTAVIQFDRLHFLKKYERYEKRSTKLKVHNPDCINAKEGDIVKVIECRPLSKTKNFVIVQKLGVEKGFREKMSLMEAGKFDAGKEAKEEDER